MGAAPVIRYRPLAKSDWAKIEALFGANGACAGCWCMFWRAPTRKDWEALRGAKAKAAFRRLVTRGEARGILAFDGDEAVGWCSFGPRSVFPATERMRSYVVADAADVWSVNCFFIRRDHRRQGIARGLLEAAVAEARRAGARKIEGYPTDVRPGTRQADAFVYKGTLGLFEAVGFGETQRLSRASPLVRIDLTRSRRRAVKSSRARTAPGAAPRRSTPAPARRAGDVAGPRRRSR